MLTIVAINNGSLMLAGRKKRSVSGDVTGCSAVQSRTSSLASESVVTKPAHSIVPINGDATWKKEKYGESSSLSNDRTSSLDVGKSSSTGEVMSGTVAKVVERRKSELTLTIKCGQAKSAAMDETTDDENVDENGDNDDSSSSSLSSSNSEDELESVTTKHSSFSSSVKSRTTAKSTNKKQPSTDSDSSRSISSDMEAKKNAPLSSAVGNTVSGCQTPSSKSVKRKKSANSQAAGRKRRRSSSSSKVGCKSTLFVGIT